MGIAKVQNYVNYHGVKQSFPIINMALKSACWVPGMLSAGHQHKYMPERFAAFAIGEVNNLIIVKY